MTAETNLPRQDQQGLWLGERIQMNKQFTTFEELGIIQIPLKTTHI
jgi:hypothetical protein